MSRFAAAKARRVLDALQRIGWRGKRRTGCAAGRNPSPLSREKVARSAG